ncbi:cyclase family protein [Dethiosulfatarculus sandiegensis]|uniref:Kynurenine formamidase n=1 Tax=Dethiosulfatarculus sandiegensis TaxID=1429043 RepID=A0A0D2HV00_9BACT|nr:cyclase family protein [Dethiosulfatarculus sandiegensis]KIX14243.1 hydrolase [Dethiosulfatarculus sandiegensis]
MRVIDLTHRITDSMPVYPGDPHPEISRTATHEEEGFQCSLLKMSSHTGTHVDAPLHLIKQGAGLENIPLENFVGTAFVIDIKGLDQEPVLLEDLEDRWPSPNETVDFVLFNSGWSEYWGHEKYLQGFPVLSVSALEWLIAKGIKGLGVDTISVDPMDCLSHLNHKLLLKANIMIFENLTNLDRLPNRDFIFSALPLPFSTGDGSPVRAVGMLD